MSWPNVDGVASNEKIRAAGNASWNSHAVCPTLVPTSERPATICHAQTLDVEQGVDDITVPRVKAVCQSRRPAVNV